MGGGGWGGTGWGDEVGRVGEDVSSSQSHAGSRVACTSSWRCCISGCSVRCAVGRSAPFLSAGLLSPGPSAVFTVNLDSLQGKSDMASKCSHLDFQRNLSRASVLSCHAATVVHRNRLAATPLVFCGFVAKGLALHHPPSLS